MAFWAARGGRKDGFPGADGSTILSNGKASTVPIYKEDGSVLAEGSATGLRQVNITTSGVLSGNISQVYAIKNPLAFIYGNEPLYDWYAIDEAHQNHSLWINGAKSNFDPCPKGWKVPTDAEVTYGDFSNTTFSASGLMHTMYVGRTYNKITWFPIAGLRYYNTGALGRVGDFGYAWSASISGIYAKRLYFSTNDISSSFTNFRGYGFPVRCIQE